MIPLFIETCVFDEFILAEELFAKVLRNLETFRSVSNNLYRKLVSSIVLPIIYDGSLWVPFLHFLEPIFIDQTVNLMNLCLHCNIKSFYTDVILNKKRICDC